MADPVPGNFVLPGDKLSYLTNEDTHKIILGPGMRRYLEGIIVTKCGILRKKEPYTYWVDNHQKRYIPARGESVIGIVINKAGDVFRVDIGSNEPASLSYLAFESATKKNRPNVQIGDLVYAKLLVASRDMEPELVCVDSYGKKSGMGVLSGGGFMFTVPLHLIRKLLSPSCKLIKTLGQKIPFEIAIGMNGRIWVRAKTVIDNIAIANAISNAEHKTNEEIDSMCKMMFNGLRTLPRELQPLENAEHVGNS